MGKKITELEIADLRIKLPVRMVMAHWEKVGPIQENEETSGVRKTIELLQLLNEDESIQNQVIDDKVKGLTFPEYLEMETALVDFLTAQTEGDKKK